MRRFAGRGIPLAISPLILLAACSEEPSEVFHVGSVMLPPLHAPAAGTAETVSITVLDAHGNALAGVPVTFEASHGGRAEPGEARSAPDGSATTVWTLGTQAGSQFLSISAAGFDEQLEAQVGPGAPAVVEAVGGADQEGTVATTLAEPVRIRVTDIHANPVPGVELRFEPSDEESTVTEVSERTGPDGTGSGRWRLGPTAGVREMRVTAGDSLALSVFAMARAGAATTVEKFAGDGQSGTVGQVLAGPIVVRVLDPFGNPVAAVPVAFQIASGAGGVDGDAVSDAQGLASTTWTLGTTVGPGSVRATVAGLDPVEFAATGVAGPPALLLKVSGDLQEGAGNVPLLHPLTVNVHDSFGNGVPGVSVSFAPAAGSGSVGESTGSTDGQGRASATWTLGPDMGPHLLAASVAGVGEVTFQATATVGAPASMTIHAGDGQIAPTGTAVGISPAVLVRDAASNPVPGVSVTFSVTGGGGSVAPAVVTTGGDGVARVSSWTLGPVAGAQALGATADPLPSVTFSATATGGGGGGGGSAFAIEVRYVGSATAGQQAAFASAADRWAEVITGDLADASVNIGSGTCGVDHPAMNESVDDLVIWVELESIDGPGNVLGSAGPCMVRGGSLLPIVGSVRLDADDLALMEANGTLTDVILHEMGHVLGVGTLWSTHGLLVGAGGSDPHFTGAHAISRFQASGGSSPNPVPVENTGGPGTADGHWRETVMAAELMTGWISASSNPLSVVTVGSLDDMGFAVSYGAADPYSLSSPPGAIAGAGPALRLVELPAPPPLVAGGAGGS